MDLGVTPEAVDFIADRGGRLYLWQEPVGKNWAADHMAFIEPRRVTPFSTTWVGGIALMLAEDLEPPKSVRIRLGRVPRRLRIEWDGERWGRRGYAERGGGA